MIVRWAKTIVVLLAGEAVGTALDSNTRARTRSPKMTYLLLRAWNE